MADTLETLEIEVKHSATGAAGEISKVAEAISELSHALNRSLITKLIDLSKAMKEVGGTGKPITLNSYAGSTINNIKESVSQKAQTAIKGANESVNPLTDELQEAIENATKLDILTRKREKAEENMGKAFQSGNEELAWRERERAINAATQAAREYQKVNKPEESDDNARAVVPQELQDLISNASQIDLLRHKLDDLRDAMQRAFAAGDTGKAYSIREKMIQVESALQKAEQAAERAGKATQQAAKGIKDLIKRASESKGPLGNFAASLKRIAFYRFLRTIIREITQAFSEGLKNAYLFSQGIEGDGHRFAEALDQMKSASTQMKNQLGSAFISLLTAIAPVIIRIIELVTKAADAIAQFFAAFTGNTYLKANSVTDHFAETMKAGGAAAKEWKNQLLGFDEINRLNEPSGGGGGGGSLLDPSTMFKKSPIDPKILETVQFLKDNFETIKTLAIAIGLALAAWKIGNFISNLLDVGTHLGSILAIAVAIGGTFLFIKGACDAWKNGVDWENLAMMIGGCAIVALALGLAFGAVAAAVVLLVGGIAMLVIGIRDWIKNGKLSTETFWLLEAAVVAVGIALAIICGWPALIVAAFAALALAVAKYWGQIVAFFRNIVEWIDGIAQKFYNLPIWEGGRTGNEGDDGIDWSTIGFASGGFPNEGQLFYARESGPELVGTMGGRTAVANNQEITEGIRQAVYDAMMAANNGNGDVSVRVFLDSREIKSGQQRLNRAMGA